jgi:hypothetical protein
MEPSAVRRKTPAIFARGQGFAGHRRRFGKVLLTMIEAKVGPEMGGASIRPQVIGADARYSVNLAFTHKGSLASVQTKCRENDSNDGGGALER